MVTPAIAGRGTTETEWAPWLDARSWAPLDLGSAAGRRVCVLAAHPDDEVLGAAGLISRLRDAGHDIVVVWATDGEASHPGSTALPVGRLGEVRRAESRSALARLGVAAVATHHLGLPDGGLAAQYEELRARLAQIVDAADLVITPWRGDGHPDHEAVAQAADGLGAIRWEYPIWMWHWAMPGDERVPWQQLRVVEVPDITVKAAAIEEFASQIRPIGPAPQDAAVLPPHVVARFLRAREWFAA
jgi:LmbE family N-acetylglucosaminyl deacetylase